MWAEDTDWLSVFRWFRIYSQHYIEFRMPSASNLYTDLLSSLVKLGGLLLPSLLLLWQASFIVCSNCWPLNKSITRLVQLRVKLIGKDSDAGRFLGQEEKGTTEDEMAGWCHRLNAHEFGWTPALVMDKEAWHAEIHGVAESRTRLSDWTELNWTSFYSIIFIVSIMELQ